MVQGHQNRFKDLGFIRRLSHNNGISEIQFLQQDALEGHKSFRNELEDLTVKLQQLISGLWVETQNQNLTVRGQIPFYRTLISCKRPKVLTPSVWKRIWVRSIWKISGMKCISKRSWQNRQVLWWNCRSWGLSQERRTKRYLYCRG